MVKKLKIGAIIQARLGSSRLPQKVLMPLPFSSEKSILEHVIERAGKSNKFNAIIVATSATKTDDALASFLTEKGPVFFRGSEEDVLSRFYETASLHELDVIVRLTADNPFIDPETIAQVIDNHLTAKSDYTRTTGLPLGLNLEVFNFDALKIANEETRDAYDREHVTAYLYTNPEKFRLNYLPFTFGNEAFSQLRLTIDYASDYALANLIFGNFGAKEVFSLNALYQFWERNSWISAINNFNFQKRQFATNQEEVIAAISLLKTNNLDYSAQLLNSALEK